MDQVEEKRNIIAREADGTKTAAEIAEICGKQGIPTTRSAVLGVVRRLKLRGANVRLTDAIIRDRPAMRPKQRKRKMVVLRKQYTEIEPRPRPKDEGVAEETFVQPLDLLPNRPVGVDAIKSVKPHECRYPYGASTTMVFCGRPRERGDYCAAHYDVVYRPVIRKR